MEQLENKTFDEIKVGDSASITKELTSKDIELFAIVSGDVNPVHLDEEFAKESIFKRRVAHGMWGGALISSVIGTKLPGPGTIYLKQSMKFKKPIFIGDKIEIVVTVIEKDEEKKKIVLDCKCINEKKEEVIVGEAKVLAPTMKITRKVTALPKIEFLES